MRKHCLSESGTLLSYPSLGPLCDIELSSLLAALKMCSIVQQVVKLLC